MTGDRHLPGTGNSSLTLLRIRAWQVHRRHDAEGNNKDTLSEKGRARMYIQALLDEMAADATIAGEAFCQPKRSLADGRLAVGSAQPHAGLFAVAASAAFDGLPDFGSQDACARAARSGAVERARASAGAACTRGGASGDAPFTSGPELGSAHEVPGPSLGVPRDAVAAQRPGHRSCVHKMVRRFFKARAHSHHHVLPTFCYT